MRVLRRGGARSPKGSIVASESEWTRGPYTVTCDRRKVNVPLVAGFLATSYWAAGISAETVARSIENSLCFALLHEDEQIGFARVITDYATIAYVGDVFVLDEYRDRGLGKWLVECVTSHPDLQGLRRWVLATRDAHELYRRFGFTPLKRPEVFMERHDPDVYRRGAS